MLTQPGVDITTHIRQLITVDLQRAPQHPRVDRIDPQLRQLAVGDRAHLISPQRRGDRRLPLLRDVRDELPFTYPEY